MLTTEQNESNNDTLYSLIEKHYCYNEDDLAYIKKRIFNPEIDATYAAAGLDDFGRKYVELKNVEHQDKTWLQFKRVFHRFCLKHNLTYENFLDNKVLINKNSLKLYKGMVKFYKDPEERHILQRLSDVLNWSLNNGVEFEKALLHLFNDIVVDKRSKKKTHAVLSTNFVDWFLCSTGNGTWSSCLSLSENSYMYWVGLPTLLADKNRAMLYVTDGDETRFTGLIKDKFITRSWLMLDQNDSVNIVRFYPHDNYQDTNWGTVFPEIEFDRYSIEDRTYTGKHALERPLINNFSKQRKIVYFPYTDEYAFQWDDYRKEFRAESYDSTVEAWNFSGDPENPKGVNFDNWFNTGTFENLVRRGVSLKYYYHKYHCKTCGDGTPSRSRMDINRNYYCLECFKGIDESQKIQKPPNENDDSYTL